MGTSRVRHQHVVRSEGSNGHAARAGAVVPVRRKTCIGGGLACLISVMSGNPGEGSA